MLALRDILLDLAETGLVVEGCAQHTQVSDAPVGQLQITVTLDES